MTEIDWGIGSKDPEYQRPFLDLDEWRDEPVRHRYVHGGFEGTDLRFSMYFPPEELYEGRFYQPLMAVSGTEHAAGSGLMGAQIEFAIESGAYLVESNLGRTVPFPGDDSTVTGFRASAATARYSRILAAEMYGAHRPYGYCYGGSGGGFKTISCLESTSDVWDGGVPFVHPTNQAAPCTFAIQAHAFRILWDKFPQIIDAVEPGGSGDMYAGLSAEEREALAETTRMGFPPRAWFDYERIAAGYTGVWGMLGDALLSWDPQYFEDFWTVPGYLGANPTESLLRARVQHKTTVVQVVLPADAAEYGLALPMGAMGSSDVPIALRLEDVPDAVLTGAMVTFTSGEAAGHNAWIVTALDGGLVRTSFGEKHFRDLGGIKPGDEVLIDNSVYLALQTYHRHQVDPDYPEWDQFVTAGQPIYPQRPATVGARYARNGAGSNQTGRFAGKMIVVQNLMDEAAFAWMALHYRRLVEEVFGPSIDERYRLYLTDHAMHGGPSLLGAGPDQHPARTTRMIEYRPVLEQALRDVAAWAEKGIPPPASTTCEWVDGQVVVPRTAAERKGIQPVVDLTVDGRDRADVSVGEEVEFTAYVEVPPSAGTVVSVEWDFEGTGDFPVTEPGLDGSARRLTVKTTHTFTEPGTYFPAVRAGSHRQGRTDTAIARVLNLGRVRVVVS